MTSSNRMSKKLSPHPLVKTMLHVLWKEHGWISPFTIHTMMKGMIT